MNAIAQIGDFSAVTQRLSSFLKRLLLRLRERKSVAIAITETKAEEKEAPQPRALPADDESRALDKQTFQFRGALLENLDVYFSIIKRLRRVDPRAFAFYSKVGARILPPELEIDTQELSPWWRQAMPTFGAVAWCLDKSDKGKKSKCIDIHKKDDAFVPARFSYFVKYDLQGLPPTVQRIIGAWSVYALTVYWDDMDFQAGVEYPIAINDAGEIRVLRVHDYKGVTTRKKRGKDRGKTFTIPTKQWKIPSVLSAWAKEHGTDPETHLARMFMMTACAFERSQGSMIQVNTEKDGLMATFSIDVKRSSSFFKDRELVKNANGRRVRIFHIVRPHLRRRGGAVKMHFRGERQFEWNGYDITISVPGLHHPDMNDFSSGVWDLDEKQFSKAGMADIAELASQQRDLVLGKKSWKDAANAART